MVGVEVFGLDKRNDFLDVVEILSTATRREQTQGCKC